jgi:hypothetical protein
MAFAATSLPLSALGIAVSVHLPAYFAANIGVELAVVGAAFAIVRFIDIPIEPALGILMDRTRSPIGRYRLWTLLGAPLLMLGLYMLMTAGRGVGQSYLITWLLVMYLGVSILFLSHSAWAATLARSYDDRARLFGVMAAVGVGGAVSVLMIPIVMEQMGYSEPQGIQAMIWYIIVLAPIAVGLVVWRTPETLATEVTGHRGHRPTLSAARLLGAYHRPQHEADPAGGSGALAGPGLDGGALHLLQPRQPAAERRRDEHPAGDLHRRRCGGRAHAGLGRHPHQQAPDGDGVLRELLAPPADPAVLAKGQFAGGGPGPVPHRVLRRRFQRPDTGHDRRCGR